MTSEAIVLQARMGSARLPGKVLARIADRTILAHCVERLSASSDLPVVVATTDLAEDDDVAREAHRAGAAVVRGSATDVLARFVMAVRAFDLTHVIRATADNPAVDMNAPQRVRDLRDGNDADHVVEDGLPCGAAVEAVRADALVRAAEMTDDAYDREHVTPFIRRDPRFRSIVAPAPLALRRPELRLTIDTFEDLAFVRAVFDAVGRDRDAPPRLSHLIAAADEVRLRGSLRGARD